MASERGRTAVFGIFQERPQAERALSRLQADGFSTRDVSVLFPTPTETRSFAFEQTTKAPEGAATGAGTGAVVGGALGVLAGIGVLAIPGLGPFIAAGPIMAALAGIGVGAGVGGIAGLLIGLGIPEYEAKRYAGVVNEGGILMSVHTASHELTKKAKQCLEQSGAEHVSATTEESVPGSEAAETG